MIVKQPVRFALKWSLSMAFWCYCFMGGFRLDPTPIQHFPTFIFAVLVLFLILLSTSKLREQFNKDNQR